MSVHQADLLVQQLRASLLTRLILRQVIAWTAAWLFAWGTAVLVARMMLQTETATLLWGGVGLPVVVVAAIVVAVRQMPSAAALRALVDARGSAGGLIVAAGEVDLGDWKHQVVVAEAPLPSWRGGRTWTMLIAAAAFATLSFLLPSSFMQPAQAAPLDVSGPTQQLQAQLETLKEEKLLEEQRAEQLRDKLQQITGEATADNPARTYESLDHLKQTLEQLAADASEKSIRQTEKMTQAEALSEAIADDQQNESPEMSAGLSSEAMQSLTQMVEELAASDPKLAEALKQAGLDAKDLAKLAEKMKDAAAKSGGQEQKGKHAQLSKEDLEKLAKLAEQMKGSKEAQAALLKKLAAAKLIDPKKLGECAAAGQCDPSGLAKFLAECDKAGMKPGQGLEAFMQGAPGQGAATRGRADAPMTWGDPKSEEGAKFKEEVLPPGMASMKDSQLLGVSRGAPKVNDKHVVDGTQALSGAAAGGGSATRQPILPRHRAAVGKYFDRK